jgi:hypothetical protein
MTKTEFFIRLKHNKTCPSEHNSIDMDMHFIYRASSNNILTLLFVFLE